MMGGVLRIDLVTYGAGLQTFMPIQAVITLHDTSIVRQRDSDCWRFEGAFFVAVPLREATECRKTKRAHSFVSSTTYELNLRK